MRDAANERPEPFAYSLGNDWPTILGAENTMKVGTDVRHVKIRALPDRECNSRVQRVVGCGLRGCAR